MNSTQLARQTLRAIRRLNGMRLWLDVFRREKGQLVIAPNIQSFRDLQTDLFVHCCPEEEEQDLPFWALRFHGKRDYYVIFPDSAEVGMLVERKWNGCLDHNLEFQWNRSRPGVTVVIRTSPTQLPAERYVWILCGYPPESVENERALGKAITRACRPPCWFPYLFGGQIQDDTILDRLAMVLPMNKQLHIVPPVPKVDSWFD